MIRERDEEDNDEEAPRQKHGPARKRFEKGSCPPMSVYQFFVIEKDLELAVMIIVAHCTTHPLWMP